MTTQISATWTGGMFKPDEALPLADQTRVRLTVEPIAGPTTPDEAWRSLKARLAARPIDSGGKHFSRDELHERR